MIPDNEDDLEKKKDALRLAFWKLRMGHGMSKVLPGLYLGNLRDGKDSEQLRKHHISHVLAIHDSAAAIYPKQLKYLCIQIGDTPQSNIQKHFPEAITFIHEARTGRGGGEEGGTASGSGAGSSKGNSGTSTGGSVGGGVLVHCVCGISRSTTLVVAYLMTITDNISWQDALRCVKYVRSSANPNLGFQSQLQKYQTSPNLSEERVRLKELYPGYSPAKDYEYLMKNLKCYQKYCKNLDDNIYPVPAAGQRRYSWAVAKDTKPQPPQPALSKCSSTFDTNLLQAPAVNSGESSSTRSGVCKKPEGEVKDSLSLLQPHQTLVNNHSGGVGATNVSRQPSDQTLAKPALSNAKNNSLRVVDFDRRRSISSERLSVGNTLPVQSEDLSYQMTSSTSNLNSGSRTFGSTRKHSTPLPADFSEPYAYERTSDFVGASSRHQSQTPQRSDDFFSNRKNQPLYSSIPCSSTKPKSYSAGHGYENVSSDFLSSGRRQRKTNCYVDRRTFFASTSTPNSPVSYGKEQSSNARRFDSHSHRGSYKEEEEQFLVRRNEKIVSQNRHESFVPSVAQSSRTVYRKSSHTYVDLQMSRNLNSERNLEMHYK